MLLTPQIVVVLSDTLLVLFAYLWLYPRSVQDDMLKLLKYDLLVSVMAILIAGVLFDGKDIVFWFFGWELNWFWYSLIWYLIIDPNLEIEIPKAEFSKKA